MRIPFVAVALLCFSGCGADETTPTPSDGKIRPPPNGVHIAEAVACKALSDAHSQTLLTVGCAGTARSCPGLVRAQSGADCLEYDQGSLDACVAHIKSQDACMDINAALDVCIVFAYEGTAPAGCP